jgi:hypothetical protein
MNSRTLTIAVALLLVVAPIAGAAGPIGVASAQTQDGFVGLPDSNVQEDLPVGANSSLRASDLEGSVMASDYADSLQVVVTTPDRASEYVNGSRVGGGGTNLALVFQDDTNHEGREVAVPAEAVRETVGYLPKVVHGVHDSGESWAAPIEARNGMLFFEIPRFSSNSVTFSSTTSITGEAATDQSSWTYDVGDTDSVSNFDINVTGNTSTESESVSGTFSDGDSVGLTVAGNTEPTGPNGQSDPQITLEGTGETVPQSVSKTAYNGDTVSIDVGGTTSPRNETVTLIGNETTSAESVSLGTLGDGASKTVDVGGNQPARDESVTLTGDLATNSRTVSQSGVSDGGTVSLNIGGNKEPTGPSGNNEPTVTFTGNGQSASHNPFYDEGGGTALGSYQLFGDTSSGYPNDGEITFNAPQSGELNQVTVHVSQVDGSDWDQGIDLYLVQESADGNYGEGTKVKSGWNPSLTTGDKTVTLDSSYSVTSGTDYTIEFVPTDGDGDGTGDRFNVRVDESASTDRFSKKGSLYSWYGDVTVDIESKTTDPSIDVDGDGTAEASYSGRLDPGQSVTREVASLGTTDDSATVSTTSEPVDVDVSFTERTATEDPSVTLGGATVSHSGILNDGETTTLSGGDLSPGSNSVDISTAAGTVGVDASWSAVTATEDPSVTVGGSTVSHTGILGPGETVTESVSLSTGSQSADVSVNGPVGVDVNWTEVTVTENPSIDIDGDGTDEISHSGVLAIGDTKTYDAPSVGLSTDQLNLSTKTGTDVILTTEWTERTRTPYPTVVVNGNEAGGTSIGMLEDGQTASLSTNTSWITDGVNDVTLQLGDGSLSGNAPTPLADLDYQHDSAAEVSTEYAANGWVERYNVSRTFPSDQQGPTLTIPHSREVYEVRYVQTRVNGGSWTDVPTEDWTLDGTELQVALDDGDGDGTVDGGDTIAVRTSAYKIQSVDGKVTVVNPTAPGDATLETEIRVDDRQPGFHVRVGGTRMGDRVHYAHQESWENPDDRVTIDSSGNQRLYLPNAKIGDQAQVTTIPLAPQLSSGDVAIRVAKPDGPTIQVSPGTADLGAAVDYRFLDVQAGEKYGLYSASRSRYVGTADSEDGTVTISDDDSEETLVLQTTDGDGGGGGDGGSGSSGGPSLWEESGPETTFQELGIVAAWVVFVLLLVAATARSSLTGRTRWILVGTVSTGSGLLSIEVLRPGMVSTAVSNSLGEILPLAGLAAIGITAYSVYQWWQARREEATTPDTSVELDLGRGD